MNLWILDQNFTQIGVIDDYKSLIWSKRYTELGDCEIYISANERTIGLLQEGNYIVRDDDDMICQIKAIELDTNTEQGDFLIISGVDCRDILNQRIIMDQVTCNGRVEEFIRRLINMNAINPSIPYRTISNLILGADNGFTETMEGQAAFEQLFDKIKELCTTYNYGSKMTFNGADFIFNLYKGVDRSIDQYTNEVVLFSPDFENLISSKYKIDLTNKKNAALVVGEGENAYERPKKHINLTMSDLDRFELYVDANDVSATMTYADLTTAYPNGQIVEENAIVYYVVGGSKIAILDHIDHPTSGVLQGDYYTRLLEQKGKEALSEAVATTSFDGEVEPNYSYKYGEDYFLGDIVTVQNEYGISANARVTEVIESDDENGYSLIPTFVYVEQTQPQPITGRALLTEYGEPITTENGEVLEIEEPMLRSAAAPTSEGVSKKISELPESTDVYDGCCMPIVTNGETKKIYYSLLKEKLSQDLDIETISNETIDTICV